MAGANNTNEKRLNELNRKLELEIQEKNQQVKELASELIAAEQKERKRIARLLHNDLQQQLFSSQTKAKLLNDDAPAEFTEKISEIIDQIGHSLQLTQQLVVSLSPPNIESNNLYKGINWLCKYAYNFHGLLVQNKEVRHIKLENNDVLILILQMIQELLFNVVKHAGVNKARITTQQKEEMIHIHVIDEGKGFNENELDSAVKFGLSQTKEKLKLIGGHLLIDSTPGKGTDVCLSVPRKQYIKTAD
jgi:signal transduction histidine kinase